MAALGDSNFLDDLDGLGEDSDEEEQEEDEAAEDGGGNGGAGAGAGAKKAAGLRGVKAEDLDSLDDSSGDEGAGAAMDEGDGAGGGVKRKKEDGDEELDQMLKRVKGDTLAAVASLSRTRRYQEHVARVESGMDEDGGQQVEFTMPLEADPQYQLIVASNKLVQDIDEEIVTVHRFVADGYAAKFPELESLVPAKLDYVRTVQRIGNEMDLTLVDLNDLLPTAAVMVVSVTASSTSGKPLAEDRLREVLAGCGEVLRLFEDRAKILAFVEKRMSHIAPNVCALVGSKIASQLMGLAGGLVALSRIPANHIQVMGQEKKTLQGLAAAQGIPHAGVILASELVLSAPPALRLKAMRLVASKVALAARMDAYQQHARGEGGQSLRAECDDKIEKWQEPPKGKEKKALPVPDLEPKKKRGGKRVRKHKERFAMTDMRKEANRRAFGDASAGTEYGDEAMGMDIGMLGATGGRLRLPAAKEQKHTTKKQQAALKAVKGIGGSSGATSGMASSLVFTPTQGLELHNPLAMEERKRKLEEANKSWFDNASGFMSARPK